MEAGIKPDASRANDLRAILGLPLQAPAVAADSDTWLHRLDLNAAMTVGLAKYQTTFGCMKP